MSIIKKYQTGNTFRQGPKNLPNIDPGFSRGFALPKGYVDPDPGFSVGDTLPNIDPRFVYKPKHAVRVIKRNDDGSFNTDPPAMQTLPYYPNRDTSKIQTLPYHPTKKPLKMTLFNQGGVLYKR